MKFKFCHYLIFLVGTAFCIAVSTVFATESITLQLKWHHQFQFAGYYAALRNGYYQDEGLDVRIVEGSAGTPSLREVLSGHAHYGIGDSDILLSRVSGKPVVALAAIFQHSPYVLLSLKERNIEYPADLIGKRIMLSNDQGATQFRALLRNQHLDVANTTIVPHSWRLQDLIEGKVDAVSAYAMDEPIHLEKMGYSPSMISYQKFGVDFYGDVLFTTDQELAKHPERVEKFLRASKRGWMYALNHREELASQIATMPGVARRGIDQQLLQKEAALMAPYVLTDVVTLGHMNEERWASIAGSYADLGIIPSDYNLDGFMYQGASKYYLKWLLSGSLALLVVLGLSVLWNIQIRRQVVHRTRALQNEVDRRTQAESLLKIAGSVAQIGGWVMDVKTGLVSWSDEVAAIHEMPAGYSPTVDEGIALFVPEYRELIKDAVIRCMAEGTPYDLELEKMTATGRRIWVRTMGQAVRDADGKIIRLQGSFQDISARKQLEAIKQGHARIQAMMLANVPLSEVLNAAVQLIEAQLPDAISAAFMLDKDGQRLLHSASTQLPEEYLRTIDGVAVDGRDTVGFEQRRLVVADIRDHTLASHCQRAALANGLQAYWMASIVSHSQHPLGVLAIYRRVPHVPAASEIEFVESYAQILGLAIERQQSDEQLDLMQSGISRLNDIFMITEAPLNAPVHQKVVFLNEAFSRITGTPLKEVIGLSPFEIFQGTTSQQAALQNVEFALRNMQPVKADIVTNNQQGQQIWLEMDALPLHDKSGWYTHWVVVMRDVTERKQTDAHIRQLAYYDTMTGLPNRLLLQEKLATYLDNAVRNRSGVALLFVDIDNFKSLNDTHGHDVGDALLVEVAHRIVQSVRRTDTVSRLGGDEFVVVLDKLSGDPQLAAQKTAQICEKILSAFKRPFNLEHYQHYTTPSIGVAMVDPHVATSVEEQLRRADLAMYQAKEAGRNTFRFFDASMETELRARVALEADLHQAIALAQFLLHFQPQYDQHHGIVGAEVLVRWQHPEHGLVMPGQFIPVAESSGQIVEIGQWVMHEACQQLLRWSQHPQYQHLVLSVNVSPKQCLQPNFVRQVQALVVETGIDPSKLKLELTESMLVANVEDIIDKMAALKQTGVCFSLDDFGTGYSSLSYLKRLPFDQLKIDQSFIRDMLQSADHESIVKAIVSLGQSLRLEVLAEGVETEAQLHRLKWLGCHTFQGYYFTTPLPIEQFEHFIAQPMPRGHARGAR